jgi:hypothetical protein
VILLACAGIVYLFTPVGDFIGQWLITFYNVSDSTAVMAATVFQLNVLAVAICCVVCSRFGLRGLLGLQAGPW